MQMPNQPVDVLPGTDLEYNLICKVQVQPRSYIEIADGKRHEANTVLLLPRLDTTEVSRFLITYLPDIGTYCLDCQTQDLHADHVRCPECGSKNVKTEHTEIPAWIAHPVHGPSRLALLRKNNYCSQHHLFVMGTGAEQDLQHWHGKEVQVKIFSSLADNEVDSAKSVEKSVDKYKK